MGLTFEGLENQVHLLEQTVDTRLRAIEGKLDRFELALFGQDGRGGLVADVNAANVRSKLAMWVAGALVFPALVTGSLWLLGKAFH